MAEYFGIDCAKWQGTIDWGKVKSAGVQFAILKATRKNNAPEEAFKRNYSGATDVGIPVGVYRYVYARNTAEATNEANSVVSVIKGLSIPCRVWLDMEDKSLIGLGKTKLLSIITAEQKVLEDAGFSVGIYCNTAWYKSILPVDKIDLPFWVARYGADNGKKHLSVKPRLQSKHTLYAWQYSSKGRVKGVPGYVDVNTAYQIPGEKADAPAVLKRGDTGERVTALQKLLNLAGHKVKVDGSFGPVTEGHVVNFQSKNGLTVDGIAGPKTIRTLYQQAIINGAKLLAVHFVCEKWHYKNGKYTALSTFAETDVQKYPGCSCAHFVSWVLHAAGLLKSGAILSHSPAGAGTGTKALVNADKLIGCVVTYPNAKISAYAANLQPGDVLVHDSSIGVWVGNGTILTAREGKAITRKDGVYYNLTLRSGYEWNHDILAVVRAA